MNPSEVKRIKKAIRRVTNAKIESISIEDTGKDYYLIQLKVKSGHNSKDSHTHTIKFPKTEAI